MTALTKTLKRIGSGVVLAGLLATTAYGQESNSESSSSDAFNIPSNISILGASDPNVRTAAVNTLWLVVVMVSPTKTIAMMKVTTPDEMSGVANVKVDIDVEAAVPEGTCDVRVAALLLCPGPSIRIRCRRDASGESRGKRHDGHQFFSLHVCVSFRSNSCGPSAARCVRRIRTARDRVHSTS